MEYKRTCTGELKKIYIEPLALLMRNPYLCAYVGTYMFYQAEHLVDKNYVSKQNKNKTNRKENGIRKNATKKKKKKKKEIQKKRTRTIRAP
jgi:hypothetical protein